MAAQKIQEEPSVVLRFKATAQAVQRNAEGALTRALLAGFKAAPDGGELDISDDEVVYRFVCSSHQYTAGMGKIGPVTTSDAALTMNVLLATDKLEKCFIDGAEDIKENQLIQLEVIATGTVVTDFLVRPAD